MKNFMERVILEMDLEHWVGFQRAWTDVRRGGMELGLRKALQGESQGPHFV